MQVACVRVYPVVAVVRITNEIDPQPPIIINAPADAVVRVSHVGLQGAPGMDGAGASVFEEAFTAEDLWIVNHNFGRKPTAVQILTVGGVEVLADIVHTSNNQLQVLFAGPFTGTVRVM